LKLQTNPHPSPLPRGEGDKKVKIIFDASIDASKKIKKEFV